MPEAGGASTKCAGGWMAAWYGTTLGKKYVMVWTGLILFVYVLVHMIGNMQIWVGRDQLNNYAGFLHSKMALPLLWSARVVLAAAVALHVLAAIQLTARNWGSRPVAYVRKKYREADYAARTMIWSGPLIALFVVYHVMHLTLGTVGPRQVTTVSWFGESIDAYHNVIAGFQVPAISAFYVVAVLLLGLHFYHGLWSWFQTIGLAHPKHNRARRLLATALALVVVVGDISIPLAVLAGCVKEGGM